MSERKPTREDISDDGCSNVTGLHWRGCDCADAEKRRPIRDALDDLELAQKLTRKIGARISRAYIAQLDEVKRLEEERDALLKKDYEEMDHEMWREVDRLREENKQLQGEVSRFRDLLFRKGEEVGKLRALVEAARESVQGEAGWSKFDWLLAEWDENERLRAENESWQLRFNCPCHGHKDWDAECRCDLSRISLCDSEPADPESGGGR